MDTERTVEFLPLDYEDLAVSGPLLAKYNWTTSGAGIKIVMVWRDPETSQDWEEEILEMAGCTHVRNPEIPMDTPFPGLGPEQDSHWWKQTEEHDSILANASKLLVLFNS